MRRGAICFVVLSSALAAAPAVHAQDTRAAALEQQREEKARQLKPYQPGRLERALLAIDAHNPLAVIAPHNGFFVEYGYSHKPTGSGIGFSGGFRSDFFNRTARVELEAGISVRNYQMLRADLSLPYLARSRIELGVEATYHHHPQEDFYGLGLASRLEDRVSYLLDDRRVEARALARPLRVVSVGARAGRMHPTLGAGTDAKFPSLETRFDATDVPGMAGRPAIHYRDLFAAVDYRDEPGNARTGGYYSVTWRRHSLPAAAGRRFSRLDVRAQQFFPIFDKKRVFAVQARALTTHPDEGTRVPFFLKPTIGGGHSLRSVRDFRFRDDNVMVVNVEYRWEAFSALDMALFADWGTVAASPDALGDDGFKRGYGIGFRFNTAKAVVLRLDIAAGAGEGVQYVLKFSRMF